VSSVDWQTAEFGNGPAVVEWLEVREDLTGLGEAQRKLVRRWRQGAVPSFWTIDRLLREFARHPSELPDAVWLDRRRVLETTT